jgi:hypothetical protein
MSTSGSATPQMREICEPSLSRLHARPRRGRAGQGDSVRTHAHTHCLERSCRGDLDARTPQAGVSAQANTCTHTMRCPSPPHDEKQHTLPRHAPTTVGCFHTQQHRPLSDNRAETLPQAEGVGRPPSRPPPPPPPRHASRGRTDWGRGTERQRGTKWRGCEPPPDATAAARATGTPAPPAPPPTWPTSWRPPEQDARQRTRSSCGVHRRDAYGTGAGGAACTQSGWRERASRQEECTQRPRENAGERGGVGSQRPSK